MYLWLPTNRCFVDAKRLLFGAWNFCWILVLKSSRLVRAKHSLLEKCEKVDVTPMAPVPSGTPPGQIHSGNQNKCCATLRPNAIFGGDARPRPPASDYECGGKSNLFCKVPSRARKTPTFGALQNSKRGNCRLASTKHLLSSIPKLRISIRARETCPSSCRDSDSLRQPSGRSLAG